MNIKTSITYSFEYTLKDRLLELFKDLEEYEFFNKILNTYSNKEDKLNDFCEIIKDNRNYYTHYPKNKKETVYKGIELSKLNECLRLIIYLILFREFELSSEEINRISRKDCRFNFKKVYSWK